MKRAYEKPVMLETRPRFHGEGVVHALPSWACLVMVAGFLGICQDLHLARSRAANLAAEVDEALCALDRVSTTLGDMLARQRALPTGPEQFRKG